MNLYTLLKDSNVRLVIDHRWMVFDTDDGWEVFEKKPGSRKTTLVLQTYNEEEAIEALMCRGKY